MGKELEIGGETDNVEVSKIAEMTKLYLCALKKEDQIDIKESYKSKPEALLDPVTISKDTVFHIAAYRGDEELLRDLLEMVPETRLRDVLTKKNVHGNTPLHELAGTDHVKAADILVRKLLVLLEGKKTVHENDMREGEELLKIRNNLGETPIYRAAALGKTHLLRYLVQEAEKIGEITGHFNRNDQLSILHIAIIGQHFDTALYLLNKYEELATLKEQNGMTSLHLLACMPTSFKSSCPMEGLQNFIYRCLPTLLDDNDEEKERRNVFHFLPHKAISMMHRAFWDNLGDQVQSAKKLKKTHEEANKLAKILVEKDTSWSISHVTDDKPICIREKELANKTEYTSEIRQEEDAGGNKTILSHYSAKPDTPLLIAASEGIKEIVEWIMKTHPQAIEHVNRNGQNIMHVAIRHRQSMVFNMVKDKKQAVKKLYTTIDTNGYTILHQAADTSCYRGGTKPGAALQLQEEWEWFKNVEKIIPTHYKMHRNKDGVTAKKLFELKHKDQYKEAKEWVTSIAESCSTVAILVAAVVFPSAFTVPGGFRGEDESSKSSTADQESREGLPILLDKPLYSLFIVMTVASLAASLTSLVLFLSILTSSQKLKDFLYILPVKLVFAVNFLLSSVTTAMTAFTSTILLTIQPRNSWTKTLNVVAALLPITVFVVAQYPLYDAFYKTVTDSLKRNLHCMMLCFPCIPRTCKLFLRQLCSKRSM